LTSVPEVVDRNGVGAAERGKLDVLDTRSMVTLPTLEQPRPAAIGRDVDVFYIRAVEDQRIGAGLTSTISPPSPGFQTKVSLFTDVAVSLPRPPVMVSLPSLPIRMSLLSLPVMVSFLAPPSIVSCTVPACRPAARCRCHRGVDDEPVVGASAPARVTDAGRPATVTSTRSPERCRCRRCR
jgi:hypothetical protein